MVDLANNCSYPTAIEKIVGKQAKLFVCLSVRSRECGCRIRSVSMTDSTATNDDDDDSSMVTSCHDTMAREEKMCMLLSTFYNDHFFCFLRLNEEEKVGGKIISLPI